MDIEKSKRTVLDHFKNYGCGEREEKQILHGILRNKMEI